LCGCHFAGFTNRINRSAASLPAAEEEVMAGAFGKKRASDEAIRTKRLDASLAMTKT
jgi:hypothetical protein